MTDKNPLNNLFGAKTKPSPQAPLPPGVQVVGQAPPSSVALPHLGGGVVIASGVMPMLSGMFMPGAFGNYDLPEDKVDYMELGNEVLQNVEAHETSRIGELAETIHKKLAQIEKTASFTNDQWKAFGELGYAIRELIGDGNVRNTDIQS